MSSKSVLIVDDDPDQHVLVGLYLEHAGYTVLHACDGGEGYDAAVSRRPSLVLLDMRMPRVDGEAAFRRLRSDPATREIPVVAVTADVLDWPESRSLREGFAGHVTKPCDLARIRDVVRKVIGPAGGPMTLAPGTFVVAAAMH
ncbi:MAG TPA: response regulator [Longimicrobium sp.]|nr:response regulator [Longimicrobium sp.]